MRTLGVLFALAVLASACTEEQSTPIDLDSTSTTGPPVTRLPELPEDDPNAEARNQVLDLAKEECRKHPDREFGVVVFVDEDGNEASRFEYPCADLEADDAVGSAEADVSGDE